MGAEGFIGSHVVACALAAGASVRAVCLRDPWRLTGIGADRLVRLERGDAWPGTTDGVVLLAYEPPPSGTSKLEHERAVNLAAALADAQRARELGARVVFASSADVYGPWHDEPVSERTPPAPATPYAQAKLEAEHALGELAVSLRLSTVYGPSEHEARAVPAFIRALAAEREAVVHGDGSDVRDYVYVGDVAAAIVVSALEPAPGEPVLNIGSGMGRSTLDVLEAVADALGAEPRARFEPGTRPPFRLALDCTLAAETLGYASREDFTRALAEEAAWLTAQD